MKFAALITGLTLMAIGIAVKHCKLHDMIAGYNTMTDEERKHFDIERFATLFRNCLVFTGLAEITGYYALSYFGFAEAAQYVTPVLVISAVLFLIINAKRFYLNKNK